MPPGDAGDEIVVRGIPCTELASEPPTRYSIPSRSSSAATRRVTAIGSASILTGPTSNDARMRGQRVLFRTEARRGETELHLTRRARLPSTNDSHQDRRPSSPALLAVQVCDGPPVKSGDYPGTSTPQGAPILVIRAETSSPSVKANSWPNGPCGHAPRSRGAPLAT